MTQNNSQHGDGTWSGNSTVPQRQSNSSDNNRFLMGDSKVALSPDILAQQIKLSAAKTSNLVSTLDNKERNWWQSLGLKIKLH